MARTRKTSSDGGATPYYDFPYTATTLNDLIEHQQMSFAQGNIFKAAYRLGKKKGSSRLYDIRKILFFAQRLEAEELKKIALRDRKKVQSHD